MGGDEKKIKNLWLEEWHQPDEILFPIVISLKSLESSYKSSEEHYKENWNAKERGKLKFNENFIR